MTDILSRLDEAFNSHDPEQMAALFAEDYRSSQPVHPGREFVGRGQVFENWSAVFRGVPDFAARLVSSAGDGDTSVGEWEWSGWHVDGSAFSMRGVTILVVRDGLIAEGRLYMEPVDAGDSTIEEAVGDLYKP